MFSVFLLCLLLMLTLRVKLVTNFSGWETVFMGLSPVQNFLWSQSSMVLHWVVTEKDGVRAGHGQRDMKNSTMSHYAIQSRWNPAYNMHCFTSYISWSRVYNVWCSLPKCVVRNRESSHCSSKKWTLDFFIDWTTVFVDFFSFYILYSLGMKFKPTHWMNAVQRLQKSFAESSS